MALPPAHVQNAVEEVQSLRGWIANGYAQVEYALGDYIAKSMELEEYAGICERLPHGSPKRIQVMRQILQVDGFFTQFAEELEELLVHFEVRHETRNLLAHGFCSVYHTPDEDVGFEFRKWHRDADQGDIEIRRLFRIVDLEYEKVQMVHVSEVSLELLRRIHNALGIVDE